MRYEYVIKMYIELCNVLLNYPANHASDHPAVMLFDAAGEVDKLFFSRVYTQQNMPCLPQRVTLFMPYVKWINSILEYFV